jgi:hypothetical protein
MGIYPVPVPWSFLMDIFFKFEVRQEVPQPGRGEAVKIVYKQKKFLSLPVDISIELL